MNEIFNIELSCFQCSKTCGTGVRTREVKCVDSTFTPSADCAKDKKPSRRQPCNTQKCDVTSDQPIKSSSDTSPKGSSTSSVSEKKSDTSTTNSSSTSSSEQQELQRDDSAQRRKDGDRDKGDQNRKTPYSDGKTRQPVFLFFLY